MSTKCVQFQGASLYFDSLLLFLPQSDNGGGKEKKAHVPLSLPPSLPPESMRMRRSKRQSPIERFPFSLSLFLRELQGAPKGFHPKIHSCSTSQISCISADTNEPSCRATHPVEVDGESRAPSLFWPPVAAYQFPYGLRHRFFDRGGGLRLRRRRKDDPWDSGPLIGKAHPPDHDQSERSIDRLN